MSADEETVEKAAETLNAAMQSWSGKTVSRLTMSVGYVRAAEFPGEGIESLAKKADERMYSSKLEFYLKAENDRRKR